MLVDATRIRTAAHKFVDLLQVAFGGRNANDRRIEGNEPSRRDIFAKDVHLVLQR